MGTILSHLEKLTDEDPGIAIEHLRPPKPRYDLIKATFEHCRTLTLTPVKAMLGEDFSFDE